MTVAEKPQPALRGPNVEKLVQDGALPPVQFWAAVTIASVCSADAVPRRLQPSDIFAIALRPRARGQEILLDAARKTAHLKRRSVWGCDQMRDKISSLDFNKSILISSTSVQRVQSSRRIAARLRNRATSDQRHPRSLPISPCDHLRPHRVRLVIAVVSGKTRKCCWVYRRPRRATTGPFLECVGGLGGRLGLK